MSRISALLLCLALVAGCGGSENEQTSSVASTSVATAPVSAPAPAPATTAASSPAPAPEERDEPGAPAPAPSPTTTPKATTPGIPPKAERSFRDRANRSCAKARRGRDVTALPSDPAQLARHARAAVPVATRLAVATSRLRAPDAQRGPVLALQQAWAAYLPLLQQAAGDPTAGQAAQLLRPAAQGVQRAAVAAGLPACGPPSA
jgi:hypothetical protein